jgi:hypothetical protein
MIFILLLVQYQRSISLFYLLIIKGNIMKKNLLLVGALVSAFLLASCSGGDKSKAPVVSTADIENAAKKLPVVNGHEGEMKSYQAFLSQVETFIKQVKKVREKGEYSIYIFFLHHIFQHPKRSIIILDYFCRIFNICRTDNRSFTLIPA